MKRLFASLSLLFVLSPSLAGSQTASESLFFTVYAKYCVGGIRSPKPLNERAKEAGLAKLNKKEAKKYLGVEDGEAWLVSGKDSDSDVVLVSAGQLRSCYVYAKEGDPNTIARSFSSVMSSPPQDSRSRVLSFDLTIQNIDFSSVSAYAWTIPGFKDEMVFVLAIPKEQNSAYKAMATASIKVNKESD